MLLHGTKVFITDFGFATRYLYGVNTLRQFVGTRRYSAPEVLDQVPFEGPQTDIWGLGLILYYLLTHSVPYEHDDDIRTAQDRQLPLPTSVSPLARDLLQRILRIDPADRLTISDILNHPWLSPQNMPHKQASIVPTRRNSFQLVMPASNSWLSPPSLNAPHIQASISCRRSSLQFEIEASIAPTASSM